MISMNDIIELNISNIVDLVNDESVKAKIEKECGMHEISFLDIIGTTEQDASNFSFNVVPEDTIVVTTAGDVVTLNTISETTVVDSNFMYANDIDTAVLAISDTLPASYRLIATRIGDNRYGADFLIGCIVRDASEFNYIPVGKNIEESVLTEFNFIENPPKSDELLEKYGKDYEILYDMVCKSNPFNYKTINGVINALYDSNDAISELKSTLFSKNPLNVNFIDVNNENLETIIENTKAKTYILLDFSTKEPKYMKAKELLEAKGNYEVFDVKPNYPYMMADMDNTRYDDEQSKPTFPAWVHVAMNLLAIHSNHHYRNKTLLLVCMMGIKKLQMILDRLDDEDVVDEDDMIDFVEKIIYENSLPSDLEEVKNILEKIDTIEEAKDGVFIMNANPVVFKLLSSTIKGTNKVIMNVTSSDKGIKEQVVVLKETSEERIEEALPLVTLVNRFDNLSSTVNTTENTYIEDIARIVDLYPVNV